VINLKQPKTTNDPKVLIHRIFSFEEAIQAIIISLSREIAIALKSISILILLHEQDILHKNTIP